MNKKRGNIRGSVRGAYKERDEKRIERLSGYVTKESKDNLENLFERAKGLGLGYTFSEILEIASKLFLESYIKRNEPLKIDFFPNEETKKPKGTKKKGVFMSKGQGKVKEGTKEPEQPEPIKEPEPMQEENTKEVAKRICTVCGQDLPKFPFLAKKCKECRENGKEPQ